MVYRIVSCHIQYFYLYLVQNPDGRSFSVKERNEIEERERENNATRGISE